MLCGTDGVPWNIVDIFDIQTKCGKYHGMFFIILSVLENIVMDLNDVMNPKGRPKQYLFQIC